MDPDRNKENGLRFSMEKLFFVLLLLSIAYFLFEKLDEQFPVDPESVQDQTRQPFLSEERDPLPPPGPTWIEPETGMEFVYVEGGYFEMGCGPWTRLCNDNEKPVHTIGLDGFWVGRYPVTQGQWVRVMGINPSGFPGDENRPVEMVSWQDVQEFISRLNKMSGAVAGQGFRLPTEAEWEFACRSGGKPENYSGSKDPDVVAWTMRAGVNSTRPVGLLMPNKLGLSDMSGNVFEWTQDVYQKEAYSRPRTYNPVQESDLGPVYEQYASILEGYFGTYSTRVIRGGSWRHGAEAARCTYRVGIRPESREKYLGVRLVVESPRRTSGRGVEAAIAGRR